MGQSPKRAYVIALLLFRYRYFMVIMYLIESNDIHVEDEHSDMKQVSKLKHDCTLGFSSIKKTSILFRRIYFQKR